MKASKYSLKNLKFDFGPRSEQWRIWWSLRTCVSVGVLTFFFLYQPTKDFLLDYTNPGFAAFVTVVVKDETLGASLWNAWICIYGTLLSTLVCYFIQVGLGSDYGYENGFPVSVCLVLLFVTVFVFQYAEIPLLGKKVGVSLLSINIISYVETTIETKNVWNLFISVIIGSVIGLIGTIFPPPMQLAGTEMQYRLQYHSHVVSSLFHSITFAWMHQPFHIYHDMEKKSMKMNKKNTIIDFTNTSAHSYTSNTSSNTSGPPLIIKNKHLRLFRNVIWVWIALKRAKYYHLSWIHQQVMTTRYSKDRYIRMELVKYLEDELDNLIKRNNEARFGPNRKLAIRVFSRYLLLIRSFLTILYRLEQLIINIEQQTKYHYIFRQFFYSPIFRQKLWQYVKCIIHCIESMTLIFIDAKSHHRNTLLTPSNQYNTSMEVIHTIAQMITAKREFDYEYFRIRRQIYYDTTKPMHPPSAPSSPALDELEKIHMKQQQNANAEVLLSASTSSKKNKSDKMNANNDGDSDGNNGKEEEQIFSNNNASEKSKSSKLRNRNCSHSTKNNNNKNMKAEEVEPQQQPTKLFSPLDYDNSKEKECFPLVSNVLFNMNSFLFLLDTTCDLLIHFWNIQELKSMHKTMILQQQQQEQEQQQREEETLKKTLFEKWGIYWDQRKVKGKKLYNNIISILSDLIPSQHHLYFVSFSFERHQFDWHFTPLIIMRLKGALVVALSMTIAAIYGLYASRPQTFLASFTIAYLAGGSAAGMNIITCINRAAGTVIACVYAIIVIYIYNSDIFQSSIDAQAVLIGIALVIFQIPCTYVRSYNLYSYSGTVAGFTAALLLIDLRQLSTEVAIARIIDTYVGVGIYILLELSIFGEFIEDILLRDMKSFVEGIERRFSHFHGYFERFHTVSQRLATFTKEFHHHHHRHNAISSSNNNGSNSPMKVQQHHHHHEKPPLYQQNGGGFAQRTPSNMNLPEYGIAGAAEQQAEGIELLSSSSPHNNNKAASTTAGEEEEEEGNNDHNHDNNNNNMMVNESAISDSFEEDAEVESESIVGSMMMDADDFLLSPVMQQPYRTSSAAAPLQFELESLHTIVNRQRVLIPFYNAEPKLLSPPCLPTRLIEECLYWQNQAMKNLQIMYWVVEACDGSRDQTVEEFILYLNVQYIKRLYATATTAASANNNTTANNNQNNRHRRHSRLEREEMFSKATHLSARRSSSYSRVSSSSSPVVAAMLPLSYGRKSSNSAATTTATTTFVAPDYETILLPLQDQFVQVESFVSTSIAFLSAAIIQLQQNEIAVQVMQQQQEATKSNNNISSPSCCWEQPASSLHPHHHLHGDPLGLISTIHTIRFPLNEDATYDPLSSKIVGEEEEEESDDDELDDELDDNSPKKKNNSNAVQKLFKDYQFILSGLQSKAHEMDDDTQQQPQQTTTTSDDKNRDPSSVAATTTTSSSTMSSSLHIASNKEIKTVNALLASTHDLVAALKGLAAAISRLQASRDIRITQDARQLG